MFKNYFNVTIRNLIKHKFYSFINILGLTAGVSCFLMILLYVADEISYDTHHQQADQIYRLDFLGTINGNTFNTCLASVPAAEAMVNDYPEVTEAVRLRQRSEYLVQKLGSEQTFKEKRVVFADSNFFTFFGLPVMQGDPSSMLKGPDKVAISKSMAEKYYGANDPVGETLVFGNDYKYEVTGVFEDIPRNTHFHFDFMLSMASLDESRMKMWMSFNFVTYLKLQEGASPDALQAKFPALVEKYIGPEVEQFMGMDLETFYSSGNAAGYSLFPLKDIHLHSDKLGELEANGDINYVYLFSAIAFFIMLIACINFMNLSTARSANRAKEVGIRKVLGAYRHLLVKQFLVEALVLSFVSFVLAYAVCFALLPSFNDLAGKQLIYTDLLAPEFVGLMVTLMIAVGLLAGSYPALYLSKFRPSETLKGKITLGMKSGMIRSGLVVFQFSLSIVMIVGTAVVFDQLEYIQNKKLGFDKEQVLMINDAWLMGDKLESFKNEVVASSSVKGGTITSFLPVSTESNNTIFFEGMDPKNDTHIISNWRIDHDYISTMGMNIIDGRDFSRDMQSDSSGIILNQAAVKEFGFDDPIGKTISTFGGGEQETVVEPYKVIGVVEDFHYESLRATIYPMVLYLGRSRGYVSFKLADNDMNSTIEFIRGKWDEFAPGKPFQYSFMDQRFNSLYDAEQQIGKIFGVFAALAVLIACLGLFGLAAFTAEQRNKEIGIRKVLGASVVGIMALLSREFLKLVLIAFGIAAPLAYFGMDKWLSDFAYRTDLSINTFVISGVLAVAVAWLTMSYQTMRAARSNPVRSLRSE
ncbi:MAG: ABC transporter permease [Cyclobacteriaceae bacterium]